VMLDFQSIFFPLCVEGYSLFLYCFCFPLPFVLFFVLCLKIHSSISISEVTHISLKLVQLDVYQ
jgi:hypothetical protein